MKHFRVVFKPDDQEISIHQGATLLEAARQAGIILTTPCGGQGAPVESARCACTPPGSKSSPVSTVWKATWWWRSRPQSRFYEHKILDGGLAVGAEIRPTVYRRYEQIAGSGGIFGVAVDIGTTTVVAKLLDMTDGQCRATQAVLNPQTRFGDDVVSRINYGQSAEHLAELHTVIIDCINELIRKLCRQAGISASSIYEACIVGNTTMNHIFLRYPVEQLGRAPYRAHSVDARDIPPGELGLDMNPAGNVHCVENIAGFVGADTTAVALAVDMDSSRGPHAGRGHRD
jgi:uncharacterized 2Fe-2S/4Fe-4S cluster protein (DUF4445 family)